ncbi:MAG: cation-binding protein [Promethearchaeota archaeon]|nr:MAG: cation-binding protein [Candidatus Lokiarchaeota archaeon]
MLPIGPLMIEHRLIERMINILKVESEKIEKLKEVNPFFIDLSVDFIRTYADQTHHGKEEDILFRELKKKKLNSEHLKIMNELIEDHKFGRKTTKELVEAKERYINGDAEALKVIIERIKTLTNFYPKHIEKEDKHFFIPVMDYFTEKEKENMLIEGQIFDRKMIHRKYNHLVNTFEQERDIKAKTKGNWIERM